jgi:DNA-binding NarL/FixJ family response regulator
VSQMNTPIRVLIVDDHPVYRDGLRALLDTMPQTEVVGEAATGEEAVSRAQTHKPDVVLMDIRMPGMNGVEATRRILEASPDVAIIALTMLEDDATILAALRAGVRGYVLKGADQSEILHAIEAGIRGEALVGAAVARRLGTLFATSDESAHVQVFPDLTQRQREILNLIAQGYNNTEIAEQLVLSPKTVRNHISAIFNVLQVPDRAQAIVRARQAGFGQPSTSQGNRADRFAFH